jgi:hypothetical protein
MQAQSTMILMMIMLLLLLLLPTATIMIAIITIDVSTNHVFAGHSNVELIHRTHQGFACSCSFHATAASLHAHACMSQTMEVVQKYHIINARIHLPRNRLAHHLQRPALLEAVGALPGRSS